MRVFTYSEARQNLAKLLDLARTEDILDAVTETRNRPQ